MKITLNTKDGFVLLKKYRSCLMGFAALNILLFHTWCKIFENTKLGFIEKIIKGISFYGVDIFFFLSGLGMFFSIQSHSILRFYYQRFRRLAIPVLISALLRYVTEGWTIWQLLGNISGVNFYLKHINCFLWFIPAIMTLYLIFPIYYKFFSLSSNKTAFTMYILILWLLASIILMDTLRIDLYALTNRIPIFCVGCLMGYLSQQRTYTFNKSIWILLVLTLILGLYLSYLTNFQNMPLLVPVPNSFMPNFLITVSLCFLIPICLELLCTLPILKLIGSALVHFYAFFGIISLELYCIQEWLFALMSPWLFQHFNRLMVNVIFFISVTALGVVLWLIQQAVWKLGARFFSVFRKSTSVEE